MQHTSQGWMSYPAEDVAADVATAGVECLVGADLEAPWVSIARQQLARHAGGGVGCQHESLAPEV